MSDFIYIFIGYRIHYSFYRDIFIPSVFAFFYAVANKNTQTLSPSPPSLTHVHRCIGYHSPTWHSLSESVRLTYLSVYHSRDIASDPALSPSPPSSVSPHSHMYTTYNPTPSPHPRSSRSRALRSFGVFHVCPGLLPPA